MKCYYHEEYDIMALIEDGEVTKFLGDFCKDEIILLIVDSTNVWYEASISPEIGLGFELIGEL